MENLLEIQYIRLSVALKWRWEDNPNEHDIGNLVTSILTYGFRDPIEYDDTAEIITSGHGRLKACEYLFINRVGGKVPNGLSVFEDGEWGVPVVLGSVSDSKEMAYKYAIDANNLVMTGGDLTPVHIAKAWRSRDYLKVIQDIGGSITADHDHIESVRRYYEKLDEPTEEEPEEELEDDDYVDDGMKKVFLTLSKEQYQQYIENIEQIKKLSQETALGEIIVLALDAYATNLAI